MKAKLNKKFKSTYLSVKIINGIKISFSTECRIRTSMALRLLVIHANGERKLNDVLILFVMH